MFNFRFYSLDFRHLPLIHHWYNLDHVQKFYAKRALELSDLKKKYASYISGKKAISGFVCYLNGKPFGYIQYYPLSRHPFEGVDLDHILEDSCGIDVFIGDETMIGKGMGKKMIDTFLKRYVFKKYSYCFVDPLCENLRAIHCYKSLGFEEYAHLLSDEDDTHLLLMKEKAI